ncbi:hypothetical protein BDB01DRAFT_723061 [Pilobolus umbonatus]|nr:hypothetical protein BDB01DRAFT_723061 [Pilobolus umbonatus]
MKDLYSFDSSQESAYNTYNEVADAYSRIFKRIGVPFVVAEADSGNIGGSKSHEYHLLSDLGEDTLLTCSGCGYTANEELAIGKMNTDRMSEQEIKEGLVSNALSKHIKISQDMNPYVLSYTGLGTGEISVNGYAVLLIPRNRQANLLKVQTKLSKYLKESKELNIQATLDVQPISQKKLDSITAEDIDQLHLFLDDSLPVNNIQSSERVTVHPSDHFRLAEEGDCCAFCETDYKLSSVKSIECGHTFYLGTKYSAALDCGYRDNNKMKKIPAEMGCYGIGVSRLLAAVAEIRHDTKGIAWPTSLAPYRICIVPTDDRKEEFKNASNEVYDELSSCYRNDIVIDDRRSGFGTKMKDTELIGYPYTIVVGQKTLGDDRIVEVHERIQGQPSQKTEISMNQLRDFFK